MVDDRSRRVKMVLRLLPMTPPSRDVICFAAVTSPANSSMDTPASCAVEPTRWKASARSRVETAKRWSTATSLLRMEVVSSPARP